MPFSVFFFLNAQSADVIKVKCRIGLWIMNIIMTITNDGGMGSMRELWSLQTGSGQTGWSKVWHVMMRKRTTLQEATLSSSYCW